MDLLSIILSESEQKAQFRQIRKGRDTLPEMKSFRNTRKRLKAAKLKALNVRL